MQTNPAVELSKIIRWSESPRNQSGRKETVYGEKDFVPKYIRTEIRLLAAADGQ